MPPPSFAQPDPGHERRNTLGEPIPPNAGYLGKWPGVEDWRYIAFYPHRLRAFLNQQGLDRDAILRTWRDRGWIDTQGDRKRLTKPLREGGGMSSRFVVVKREAIEGVHR